MVLLHRLLIDTITSTQDVVDTVTGTQAAADSFTGTQAVTETIYVTQAATDAIDVVPVVAQATGGANYSSQVLERPPSTVLLQLTMQVAQAGRHVSAEFRLRAIVAVGKVCTPMHVSMLLWHFQWHVDRNVIAHSISRGARGGGEGGVIEAML